MIKVIWKFPMGMATTHRFLMEGKAKFAPNTTNSFVDDFIAKYSTGDSK